MSRPTIKQAPEEREVIRVLELGEDAVLAGCQLAPRIDGDDLVVSLILVGGRKSPLVGMIPRAFPAAEIARIPLIAVRRGLGGAVGPQESLGVTARKPDISPAARPDEPAAAAPDTSPPLILGGSIGG